MDNQSLSVLKELLATPTPTGFEHDGMMILAKHLKRVKSLKPSIDIHGNLHAVVNPKAPLTVMIEGHCDEIGFIVQYIDEKGFLYLAPLGGVTIPLVAAERIVIRGKDGPVYGVFGVRPPHLMSAKEREKVAPSELKSIACDIGATSREDAEKRVALGAPAVVNAGWLDLGNDRIACRGGDNRLGAFIVTEALRRLALKKPNVCVHLVASVQEEVGLIGGMTAAFDVNPDIGICVDVTFATDAQPEDRKAMGDVKLGAGPVLALGPTYHTGLRMHIAEACVKAKIPVQTQVRSRGNGTCAYAMRLEHGGAAVAQVSIPLRYMHSPVEVVSLSDVEKTIDLLVAAITALPADFELLPEQP